MLNFFLLISLCWGLVLGESLTEFLNEANHNLALAYDQEVLAQLQHEIQGPNDLVALLQIEIANERLMKYINYLNNKGKKFKKIEVENLKQRRLLSMLPQLGYEALTGMELRRIYSLSANMSESYKNVKLCAYENRKNCTLSLIPDVQTIVQESKNIDEIEYYWYEWRRSTGLSTRSQFVEFMELYKKTARLNGYLQAEDYWFRGLELNGVETLKILDGFMAALRPLFLQFHAHVRGSLRKMYGERLIPKGRPYPQHLSEIFIGNAFRRVQAEWFVDLPAPNVGLFNITEALQRRGWTTTQRVFWNVAEYFRGIGLPQLESSLWTFAQPMSYQEEDHCFHKAWRFYALRQINFTYCPLNDEERFFNMFEAQSDVHFFRATAEQPTLLQEEPFPHFSDAIGKCFSLAATSPRYLHKIGLIRESKWFELPARLNRLYIQGLRVIFLLPVFYVLDRYRVEALSGHIKADDNEAYWRLTEFYTGAAAPKRRTNADFDVPAKLLMEVDDQYASQIFSTVLQFQLLKHFCSRTGQDRPLDLCDLSDQSGLGPGLRRTMALGSSQHYSHVLQKLLGETELNIDGLLSYFQPLHNWLVQQNRLNNLDVGWA
ncbi:uncharacterized protein Dwil_GK15021 [Drosophila willistoni]|uniref:Angiotensin-converting enzyme n=1 Tax=Drosophila willistoni TaxID=7260 RepID=B4MVP7_DROWI|nr:angiotensin-converting enzyme [Drosophila willistoni]EDW75767.2 uncharacterized protein Dwil_GK15021 [Drosophila willistoni]